jgi:6-phosphofructokinase
MNGQPGAIRAAVVQVGGPTPVINRTLIGVVKALK